MTSLSCKLIISTLFLPCSLLFAQVDKEIFLFEPHLISTDSVEYAASFSASGTEVYFARSADKWGSGNMKSSIYYSAKSKGKWSKPSKVSFSGQFDDSDPHISKDEKSLYFVSTRPAKDAPLSQDIWVVKKDKTGKWGIPTRLDDKINSESREYSPRTDDEGNLYFASDKAGGQGQGDIYRAELDKGNFKAAINLGEVINSDKGEWNVEINGSGTLIIFEASERKENISGYGDLYISFNKGNQWSIPQHIKELNTSGSDLYPDISADSKTLFFSSSKSLKSPDTNIYFTAFKPILKKYKRLAVFPK